MKLLWFLLAPIALYLIVVGTVYFFQRRLQYFPTHRELTPSDTKLFQEWKTETGKFLGFVYHVPQAKGRIIFFHGNGGEAIDRRWMALLAPKDFSIYLPEYPGYGPLLGTPTEKAIFEIALEQFDHANPTVVVGESLGTGVASYVASQRKVEKLILISPFSSASDVARKAYPFLPVGLVMKDPFESVTHLSKAASTSLLIFHGNADSVIPISFGKKLSDSFSGKKKFIEIPNADHNEMAQYLLQSPYHAEFQTFSAK